MPLPELSLCGEPLGTATTNGRDGDEQNGQIAHGGYRSKIPLDEPTFIIGALSRRSCVEGERVPVEQALVAHLQVWYNEQSHKAEGHIRRCQFAP